MQWSMYTNNSKPLKYQFLPVDETDEKCIYIPKPFHKSMQNKEPQNIFLLRALRLYILNRIPIIGNLCSKRKDKTTKTERRAAVLSKSPK